MDRRELTNLALRYTAAWCSRDHERVAAFFAEDGALTVNGGAPARGRAAIADVARGFMSAFPDLAVHMDSVEAPELESGRAVYRWTLTGTPGGVPRAARPLRINGREEWLLTANAEIQDSRGFFDETDYHRQLADAEAPTAARELVPSGGEPQGPHGLGGWLILVGLALCLAPLRLLSLIVTTYVPLWQSPGWVLLTTPGTELYRPGLSAFIAGELLGNVAFAVVSVYLLVLFFRRSRRFPRTWAIYMLATVAFFLADGAVSHRIMPEQPAFDSGELFRTCLPLMVWLPYIAASKRVKNTFVMPR